MPKGVGRMINIRFNKDMQVTPIAVYAEPYLPNIISSTDITGIHGQHAASECAFYWYHRQPWATCCKRTCLLLISPAAMGNMLQVSVSSTDITGSHGQHTAHGRTQSQPSWRPLPAEKPALLKNKSENFFRTWLGPVTRTHKTWLGLATHGRGFHEWINPCSQSWSPPGQGRTSLIDRLRGKEGPPSSIASGTRKDIIDRLRGQEGPPSSIASGTRKDIIDRLRGKEGPPSSRHSGSFRSSARLLATLAHVQQQTTLLPRRVTSDEERRRSGLVQNRNIWYRLCYWNAEPKQNCKDSCAARTIISTIASFVEVVSVPGIMRGSTLSCPWHHARQHTQLSPTSCTTAHSSIYLIIIFRIHDNWTWFMIQTKYNVIWCFWCDKKF